MEEADEEDNGLRTEILLCGEMNESPPGAGR